MQSSFGSRFRRWTSSNLPTLLYERCCFRILSREWLKSHFLFVLNTSIKIYSFHFHNIEHITNKEIFFKGRQNSEKKFKRKRQNIDEARAERRNNERDKCNVHQWSNRWTSIWEKNSSSKQHSSKYFIDKLNRCFGVQFQNEFVFLQIEKLLN